MAQAGVKLFHKAPITISIENFNYNNIFLVENIAELSKYIRINYYVIKLEKGKQLSFKVIYNLKLVELKLLKTYIKINQPITLSVLLNFPLEYLFHLIGS